MFTQPTDRRRRFLLRGQLGSMPNRAGGTGSAPAAGPDVANEGSESDSGEIPDADSGVLLRASSLGGATDAASSPNDPFAVLTPGSLSRPIEVHLRPGGGPTEVLRLDAPLVLIGRDAGCDLRLASSDVSGRHAALVAAGDRYLAIDLGGRMGLYVNGQVAAYGWFGPGDELGIGSFRLSRPPEENGFPSCVPATSLFSRQLGPPARLALRLCRPGKTPAVALIERPLTLLGRSPACKVRLADRSVSDVHAGLFLSRDGLLAIDLLSREGLAVNGRTVRAALLQAGDRFRVGAVELEVVDSATGHPLAGYDSASIHEGPPRPGRPIPGQRSARSIAAGTAPSDGFAQSERNPPKGRRFAEDDASRRPKPAAQVSAAVADLLRDELQWSAEFVRDVVDLILPYPDEMIAAELDRLIELSERLNRLRLERAEEGWSRRAEPGIEVFDAEREHCRRTILGLLGELIGRGVDR